MLLKLIYLLGLVIAEGLRFPQRWKQRPVAGQTRAAQNRRGGLETALLGLLVLGVWVLPLVYCLTPWLVWADYRLPDWCGWLGTGVFVAGLALRWLAQRQLGRNYSSTLTVWKEHQLVTGGIYRHIRHPIYAALWLWGIAQPLLLHNWLAGWAGLAAIAPLYFLRVPREEAMLLEQFGDEYRQYMARTGRLLPRRHE